MLDDNDRIHVMMCEKAQFTNILDGARVNAIAHAITRNVVCYGSHLSESLTLSINMLSSRYFLIQFLPVQQLSQNYLLTWSLADCHQHDGGLEQIRRKATRTRFFCSARRDLGLDFGRCDTIVDL